MTKTYKTQLRQRVNGEDMNLSKSVKILAQTEPGNPDGRTLKKDKGARVSSGVKTISSAKKHASKDQPDLADRERERERERERREREIHEDSLDKNEWLIRRKKR